MIRILVDEPHDEGDSTPAVYTPAEGVVAGLDLAASGKWWRDTYIGATLKTGEHNYYDDSDFYAIVWDVEAGKSRKIEYATTRGWTYGNQATVDATDEIKAAYRAWQKANMERAREELAREEALKPRKGKMVRVVRGRKIPVGTVGVVFWFSEGAVSRWHAAVPGLPMVREPGRVGIEYRGAEGDALVREFTSERNVEVVT